MDELGGWITDWDGLNGLRWIYFYRMTRLFKIIQDYSRLFKINRMDELEGWVNRFFIQNNKNSWGRLIRGGKYIRGNNQTKSIINNALSSTNH